MNERIDNRSVSAYWLERDHREAIAIHQQLAQCGPGITVQHVIDLNRFCECCEDDEGYDVPKERMRDLKRVDLVYGGRFGWYTATTEGQRIRRIAFDAMLQKLETSR